MYFHKPREKPRKWGSFADVQYAIRINSEKIYGCDPDNDVLIMPGFWGLPLLDYSVYGNNGVNYGSTYKDGSLSFNGTTDYINCGQPYNPTTQLSMSGWMKYGGLGDTGYPRLFGVEGIWILYLGYPPGKLSFYGSGQDLNFPDSPATLEDGSWHFVGMVYDGDGIEGFVNDASVGSIAKTGDLTDIGAVPFTIANRADQTRSFKGAIGETLVSKVARTSDTMALFHDNPYGLYQPVRRPIWSIPAVGGLSIPIAQYYYQQQRM